ncbi:MAG: 2-iminobutanoate/2-iminopropanoate deaminase [Halieaceae bacterium]|jgi:2-iminobutanoate/2-iminopropanoate deaminase
MMDALQIKTSPDPMETFHISQGYKVGDLVFTSGQAAIDQAGNLVGVGDFDAQAEQVFSNLNEVLCQAGSSLAQVIKVTIYLKDMANFPKIIALRERHFTAPYPADTIIEVTSLAMPELEIEIEAIAIASGQTKAPTAP